MEAEEAWDLFKAQASADLRKSASMAGQLDTLAAQMQDIQTGVNRLTTLIPKLMGDETAIDAANEEAVPPAPAPDMGGEEGMASGEDFGPPMSDDGSEDEEAPDEETPMEEDEMSKAEDEKPEDTRGASEEAPEEEEVSEEVSEEEEPAPEAPIEDEAEDDEASFLEEEPPMEEEISEDIVEEPEAAPAEAPAQSEGLDFYASLLALLVQAASKATQDGDANAMASLAKSAGAMQNAYAELAPVLDGIFGTDSFTKSYEESVAVENELSKSSEPTDITGANHPDDMMEKSEAPAEITDSPSDLEKCGTKMPDVEDEKGKTPTDKTKVGPTNMEKSAMPQMRSFEDMMKSGDPSPFLKSAASTNMPDVPENGEDQSVTGTASENTPDVPENGSDMSVTGSKSTGMKDIIDPGSEKSELQKGDDATPTQMDECRGAMAKSAIPGKRLMSMKDIMAGGPDLLKSSGGYTAVNTTRPDSIYSAGGDVRTPEFGTPALMKNTSKDTSFRALMEAGASPQEFVEADWKQYNLFKAKGRY